MLRLLSSTALIFPLLGWLVAGCAQERSSDGLLVPVPPGTVPEGPGVPPPFAVSDQFKPSGFMGDLETFGALTIDGGACPSRPEGAQGECYKFDYEPRLPGEPGMQGWAGLLWQHPEKNWGTEPGLLIAPGAREVSFYARGESGGEIVKFKVGGTHDPMLANADTLDLELPVTLAAGPNFQRYTIPLADVSYSEVIAGFGWVIEPLANTEHIVFYVDDVRWQ